jgi:translation initiation factor 6
MAGIDRAFIFNMEIIGAFSIATNKVCFLPKGVSQKTKELFKEILEVEIEEATIAESSLIGIFVAFNEKGILLPWNSTKEEKDKMTSYFENVEVLKSKYNALGNLISCNSSGAVLHINFNEEEINLIKETLKVKNISFLPEGENYLASFLYVNDKGFLASNYFSEKTLEMFKNTFNTNGGYGSVNRGSKIIKLGLICNNKGGIVGGMTTGVEIGKIDQIFFGKSS